MGAPYQPTKNQLKRALKQKQGDGLFDARLTFETAVLGNFLGNTILFWANGVAGNRHAYCVYVRRNGNSTRIGTSRQCSDTLAFGALEYKPANSKD